MHSQNSFEIEGKQALSTALVLSLLQKYGNWLSQFLGNDSSSFPNKMYGYNGCQQYGIVYYNSMLYISHLLAKYLCYSVLAVEFYKSKEEFIFSILVFLPFDSALQILE